MKLVCGDCLEVMKEWSVDSVDLVFGSPPYVDARTYGIDFSLTGQAWVDWMVERTLEAIRICKGLVAFVVEGKTKRFRWDATPALLMADLHRAGIHLRKPPIFQRHGIPGSGGRDWLRNDYEFIVCCTKGGQLPWSDNVSMGKPCKYKTGGAMSYRHKDGQRRNARTGQRLIGNNGRPETTNPGNVIACSVGKGHMGDDLAHENEAPFPERLAEFFVRSFCLPGGVVLDPFCGSGTTCAVAAKHNRDYIGIDIRQSQIELTRRRVERQNLPLFD